MTVGPVRILLVEDEPGHAELARRAFEARGGAFLVSVVETVKQAQDVIAGPSRPDLVIADWLLPDGEGLDLLRADGSGSHPPVVIMTSQGNERVAVEVMRAGASDYLVKSEAALADLPHVVERALRQRRIEDALGDLAEGTAGTGRGFFELLVLRLANALRVKYVTVGELASDGTVRSLARCLDGRLVSEAEHFLAVSPCGEAGDGRVQIIPEGVSRRFPCDPRLGEIGGESYLGIVLRSSGGRALGALEAIHDRPLEPVIRPEAVLQVFAARAAAEIDRMRADRELQRQRVFAESLLDVVASLVIVVDPEGRIVRFNRACAQLSGWSEDEVRGRRYWEVLRPIEERERAARPFTSPAFLSALPPAAEAHWVTRGGQRRLISWSNRAILGERGDVAYVIGTGVDITESRLTEGALRASEERYRTLVENAPEAILVRDAETGVIVEANSNAARLFGHGRDVLLGLGAADLLPERQPSGETSPAQLARLSEEALAGGAPVAELVVRDADGRERPCEVRLVRLPGGGRPLVRVSLIDVADRKRLEADLRRAAVEWRETFDSLPLGVLVVDGEGRVVRANRSAVDYSGRAAWSELIDSPLAALGPGEPWLALGGLVGTIRAGGAPIAREVTDPDTRRTWLVSGSALPADREGARRVIVNFQDVTETVGLKERLRQNETMAAIGSIVAGVAHEVRNPLFSISATLDAFESRFGRADGHDRYLGVLRGEIGRLTTLMKDLLDFGRPSRLELSEWRLEEVVAQAAAACAELSERRGVGLVLPGDVALPVVLADRQRLTQVLQNLVENAIYFSPPGGTVSLEIRRDDSREEPALEIAVRDSGPGFSSLDLPRLFEPFFSRRRGGTGLGLSIVKRIVEDHGGHVVAENHPEGGAVVRVRLRAVRA